MSDWSKAAVKQVQTDKQAKQVLDRKIVEDRELCRQRTLELWNKLTTKFASECKEFNSEPGMANTLSFVREAGDGFVLSAGSNRLTGKVDQTNSRFNFVSTSWKPAHFKLEVQVPAGAAQPVVVTEQGAEVDLDSFAIDHLNSVLGIGPNESGY